MRVELITKDVWRRVMECDCGEAFFTAPELAPHIWLCPACSFEVMKSRHLIEAMIQKQLETEAMNAD